MKLLHENGMRSLTILQKVYKIARKPWNPTEQIRTRIEAGFSPWDETVDDEGQTLVSRQLAKNTVISVKRSLWGFLSLTCAIVFGFIIAKYLSLLVLTLLITLAWVYIVYYHGSYIVRIHRMMEKSNEDSIRTYGYSSGWSAEDIAENLINNLSPNERRD